MSSILLSVLNDCSRDEFVAALGNVFEYSPWIAEHVAIARPFAGVQQLFDAMKTVVDQTAPDRRLALIRGHQISPTRRSVPPASPRSPALNRTALDSIG